MPLTALIVEDDLDKAKQARDGLIAAGIGVVTIVGDAISAKLHLRQTFFHLVVLDIALPMRAHEDPTSDGGLQLLREVKERELYKQPRYFIGLTAHENTLDAAISEFGAEQWSVILYDRSSQEWLDRLQGTVRHIVASENSENDDTTFMNDVCVITALGNPELDAILALDWAWKQVSAGRDATTYHAGETHYQGTIRKIVAAKAPGMGMAPAAVLATKMLLNFRPRCIVMCGICAGERSEVQLGDLLVANPSWDYGSGKHSIKANVATFEPAPQPYGLSTRVRGIVEQLEAASDDLNSLRNKFPGLKPSSVISVKIGPLASGAAVLADERIVEGVKTQQNRKLLGVDMEAYGVMTAAAEVPAPRPEALIMKGVSDFADSEKNDNYRHYAAFVSAGSLRLLVEKFGL